MARMRMLFTSRPFGRPLRAARSARGGGEGSRTHGRVRHREPYVSQARRAGFDGFQAGPDEGFRQEWAPRFPGFDQLVGDTQRRFFFTEIFANLELVPRAATSNRSSTRGGPT